MGKAGQNGWGPGGCTYILPYEVPKLHCVPGQLGSPNCNWGLAFLFILKTLFFFFLTRSQNKLHNCFILSM